MARSYVGYDEFLKTAQQDAEQQQLAYAAARQQRAQDTLAALTSATEQELSSLKQHYRAQAEKTEQDYRSLYDENAIRERIAQLNVEEAMANMGLSDSGLNRTQQTALSATRMRADAQAAAQKQAALDALLLSARESAAKNHQTLLERSADVLTSAGQDVEKNAQTLYNNATSRAKTQFDADVDYVNALLANERSAAEQASKQALSDATLQLQREKQAAELQLQREKQAADQALAQQKLQNDLAVAQQKAAASSSGRSSSSSTTSASERAKNLKILQELLEKRVNIFNPEWRANYDELIEYYKTLVYGS